MFQENKGIIISLNANMCVCNNFKPPLTGWDQPEKTDAMPHVTSDGFKIFKFS